MIDPGYSGGYSSPEPPTLQSIDLHLDIKLLEHPATICYVWGRLSSIREIMSRESQLRSRMQGPDLPPLCPASLDCMPQIHSRSYVEFTQYCQNRIPSIYTPYYGVARPVYPLIQLFSSSCIISTAHQDVILSRKTEIYPHQRSISSFIYYRRDIPRLDTTLHTNIPHIVGHTSNFPLRTNIYEQTTMCPSKEVKTVCQGCKQVDTQQHVEISCPVAREQNFATPTDCPDYTHESLNVENYVCESCLGKTDWSSEMITG